MAAGLGFKDFVTGEVLTAADVDGYLMQGVWVFASAAARDAAVTAPQEGNFAYLKDTNVTTYYTGSAWANLDTTGMTNPMTTTGDTIYSSSGSTPARLGIGSTGQVLTVSGGVPTWATAASGGGMTLLSTTSLSGASTTATIDATGYQNVQIVVDDWQLTGDGNFRCRVNGANADPNYAGSGTYMRAYDYNTGTTATSGDQVYLSNYSYRSGNQNNTAIFDIPNANNTATWRVVNYLVTGATTTNANYAQTYNGGFSVANSSALGSFTLLTDSTFSGGTIKVWGIK